MRHQPPTFTKEKAAFLLVALFCAALLYAFIASRPTELQPGAQLAFSKKDPAQPKPLLDDLRSESAYFAGTRKSPFVVPPPKKPIIEPGVWPPYPPKEKENPDSPDEAQKFVAFTGKYNFAGVIIHEGSAHALLLSRANATTIRTEPGKAIDGGYSVTRVNKQSIELRHANGQRYLLRDRPE